MRILHWVPGDMPPIYWSTVTSWVNVDFPRGAQRTFRHTPSGDRKEMPHWNGLVEEFREGGYDWLFSTHMDVQFLPGTFKRLLSWDKPLISAMIFMRQAPSTPHIWRSYESNPEIFAHRMRDTREWLVDHPEAIKFGPTILDPRPADALAEVDFTSTSCCLIHRSVINAMDPPWFEMHDNAAGGEDARFFVKAHNAGFPAYVDRSCIAGHNVGDIASSSMDFMMWSQSSEFKDTGEPGSESHGNTTG